MGKKKSFFSRVFSGKKKKVNKSVLKAEREDSLKDLEAIKDFFEDMHYDVARVKKNLEKMIDLEKERKVANSGLLQINLQTQGDMLDPLLEDFEAFEDDVVIQGIRLKRIAREWTRLALKAGMKDAF